MGTYSSAELRNVMGYATSNNIELRGIIRTTITPALYILGIMSAADPDSKASVVTIGAVTMLAMAGVYAPAPVLAACWTARRTRTLLRGIPDAADPESVAEENSLTANPPEQQP